MSRLMQQTTSLFQQAHKDPDVRAIVLSARGKAFSAGLDCMHFLMQKVTVVKDPETQSLISPEGQIDPARTARILQDHIKQAQACTAAIATCTKPYPPKPETLLTCK